MNVSSVLFGFFLSHQFEFYGSFLYFAALPMRFIFTDEELQNICRFENSIWIVPSFPKSLKCFHCSVWTFFTNLNFVDLFPYFTSLLKVHFFPLSQCSCSGFLSIRILCLFLIVVYSSKCKFRISIDSALFVWANNWALFFLIQLQFISPEVWENDWFLLGIKCQVKLTSSLEKEKSDEWSNGKVHYTDYLLQFAMLTVLKDCLILKKEKRGDQMWTIQKTIEGEQRIGLWRRKQ